MLGRKGRILILIFVLLAVTGILAKTYLFDDKKDFAVTSKPYEAYRQSLADGKPVFLEFYADWCPGCVLMEPVILALEEKYYNEVAFIIADVDDPESEKLLKEFNVSSIPVFFYIDRDGRVAGKDAGKKSFKQMEERILTYLLTK